MVIGNLLAGALGMNGHIANGVAALFLAATNHYRTPAKTSRKPGVTTGGNPGINLLFIKPVRNLPETCNTSRIKPRLAPGQLSCRLIERHRKDRFPSGDGADLQAAVVKPHDLA